MSSNEFQGSLYRSQRDMLDAIAYCWLTSGDVVGEYERGVLAETTDEQLAAECVEGWALASPPDNWPDEAVEPSHMQREGYGVGDLIAAFGRLREIVA